MDASSNATSFSSKDGSLFVGFPVDGIRRKNPSIDKRSLQSTSNESPVHMNGMRKNNSSSETRSLQSTSHESSKSHDSRHSTMSEPLMKARKTATHSLPMNYRNPNEHVVHRKLSFESISSKALSTQIQTPHIDTRGFRICPSSESSQVYEDEATDVSSQMHSNRSRQRDDGILRNTSGRSNKSAQKGHVHTEAEDRHLADFMSWGHHSSSCHSNSVKSSNIKLIVPEEPVIYGVLQPRTNVPSVTSQSVQSDEYDSKRPWRKPEVIEDSKSSVADSKSFTSSLSRVHGGISVVSSVNGNGVRLDAELGQSQAPSDISYQSGSELSELMVAKKALTQNEASLSRTNNLHYDGNYSYRPDLLTRRPEPFHPGPSPTPLNMSEGPDSQHSDHSVTSQNDGLSSTGESIPDDLSKSSSVHTSHTPQEMHEGSTVSSSSRSHAPQEMDEGSTVSSSSRSHAPQEMDEGSTVSMSSHTSDCTIDSVSGERKRLSVDVRNDDVDLEMATASTPVLDDSHNTNLDNFAGGLLSTTNLDTINNQVSPRRYMPLNSSRRPSSLPQLDETKPYIGTGLDSDFNVQINYAPELEEESNPIVERQADVEVETTREVQHQNTRAMEVPREKKSVCCCCCLQ